MFGRRRQGAKNFSQCMHKRVETDPDHATIARVICPVTGQQGFGVELILTSSSSTRALARRAGAAMCHSCKIAEMTPLEYQDMLADTAEAEVRGLKALERARVLRLRMAEALDRSEQGLPPALEAAPVDPSPMPPPSS